MEEYQEYLRRIKQQYVGTPATNATTTDSIQGSASDRFQVPQSSYYIDTSEEAYQQSTTHRTAALSPSRRYQPQPQSAHHVSADRSHLLRLLEGPVDRDNSSTLASAPTHSTPVHKNYSQDTGKLSQGNTRYHKEILAEVEKLSSTITAMHSERAAIEATFAQRLRDARREIEEKEARLQELEARLDDATNADSDLKNQLVAAKRDTLRYQRECEMYRQQVLLHTDQQQQLQQALRDGEEREKLVVAQEQCMRELEVRYESAATTAREYEQRFLRLQQHQQAEVQGQSVKETQWREMMSSVAGALLLLVKEVEDTTVRLVSTRAAGDLSVTHSRGSSPSPSRRSLSFQTERSSSELDEAQVEGEGNAARNIERALDAMEAALEEAQPPTGAHRQGAPAGGAGGGNSFRKAKDSFSEAIQVHCRRFGRAMSNLTSVSEELRSRQSKASHEASRFEEALGRAEANAAASLRENTQLRRERQELISTIEKLSREGDDMKGRLLELVSEAEKRESSNAQHADSLKQLIEGADLDLHRYRMRVNELEALNTRVLSQKALAEEESRSTIQQLRQSVALKDSQVAKLRADLEQQRFRGDFGSNMMDPLSDGADLQHRSISAGAAMQDLQSVSGAQSVVGTSFLRQQNQQLAAHIEALQRRMDRMKEEKDTAVRALEKHRDDGHRGDQQHKIDTSNR